MAKQSKSAEAFLKRIEYIFEIKIEREFKIGRKSYDGRWNNILIEIDGLYWHGIPEAVRRDKLKESIAKENGYDIHRFRVDTIADVPSQFLRYYPKLKRLFKLNNRESV